MFERRSFFKKAASIVAGVFGFSSTKGDSAGVPPKTRKGEITLRAWNKPNHAFTYATIKEIWINGWHCCEGTGEPRPPKDARGIFTEFEALKKTTAFMPTANWEIVTGPPEQDSAERVMMRDIMDSLKRIDMKLIQIENNDLKIA